MGRRPRSILGSLVVLAATGVAAYSAYRFLSKGQSRHPRKRFSKAVSKEKTAHGSPISDRTKPEPKGKLNWIGRLRAREQKILSVMPRKKPITMAEISRKFPHLTPRTLRRDMDHLVKKGRIKKTGSTRSTTYITV